MKREIRVWRKRLLLDEPYGHDILYPMSPSTLKIEHHDPGGLSRWEDLAECAMNFLIVITFVWLAAWLNPVFGLLVTIAVVLALPLLAGKLRFRFFPRRPRSITMCYEPAEIPQELVTRYEQASRDLEQAMVELEDIAMASGIGYCHGLKRVAKSS